MQMSMQKTTLERSGPDFHPKMGYLELFSLVLSAITYGEVSCDLSSIVLYTPSALIFSLMGLYLLLPLEWIIIQYQGLYMST